MPCPLLFRSGRPSGRFFSGSWSLTSLLHHPHSSPRNTEAGRMCANRRNGYAASNATITVSATEIGYTMSRGSAATPNTALPSPIEITMPTAAPINPPANPNSAASAQNNPSGPPQAPPPHKKKRPTPPHRSANRFHQANVVLALHRHIGHRRHHAQRRQHQHHRHRGGQYSRNFAVQLRLAFRELANRKHINVRQLLAK